MVVLYEVIDEYVFFVFVVVFVVMNESRGEDEDASTIICEDNFSYIFIFKVGFLMSDCVLGELVKFYVVLRLNFVGDLDVIYIDVDFIELDAYELSDVIFRTLCLNEWLKIDFEVILKCGYVCEVNFLMIMMVLGYELVFLFIM